VSVKISNSFAAFEDLNYIIIIIIIITWTSVGLGKY
jgi:hypothetical protein